MHAHFVASVRAGERPINDLRGESNASLGFKKTRLEAAKKQRCWVTDVIKTISLLNQLESADVTQGDPEAYGPSEQTFKDRTFIGHGGAGDVDELATAEEEVAEAEETRARL